MQNVFHPSRQVQWGRHGQIVTQHRPDRYEIVDKMKGRLRHDPVYQGMIAASLHPVLYQQGSPCVQS
jgi:hypothetical protein